MGKLPVLLLLALTAALPACGQKGPLVLPDAQHPRKKPKFPAQKAPATPAPAPAPESSPSPEPSPESAPRSESPVASPAPSPAPSTAPDPAPSAAPRP